ncbi:MAG: DUF4215 domain-containing protein [Deltaproteobacteria bacterium]|nr:DUF4215 domain-containing protein [Deltaproteobacteria bacterium]
MHEARGSLVRPAAVVLLVALVAACGLQTSGVGPGGDGGGDPEVADGDFVPPDDGTDDLGPSDDGGDVPDTSPTCGNGRVEAGEECDDGNPDDSDDCPTTCRFAFCGDGFLRAAFEACDDGGANSDSVPNACRTDCARPRCGDGVVDIGEACDDGNSIDDDECRNDCRPRDCGDGIVNGDEECDDGNPDNTDACLNTCVAATCGDGYLWDGEEECDGDARDCTTTCGSTGSQDCVACVWSATCTPPVELCNGRDDDCDGAADNGFACRAGETTSCTTTCGSVGAGTCTDACLPPEPAACTPPAEVCNGVDDDCDALIDEGFTLYCDIPHDHPAVDLCTDPGETLCNGIDDNCNGLTDEGFECSPGATRPCTNDCGVAGTQACAEGCTWGACCAPAEVCQPVGETACDDDCDGTVDEDCGIVAPPNNTCVFATPIATGTIHGDTTAASHTATPCSGGSGRDLWYTFTLSGRRIVYLDTVDGNSWSTVLEVRSGACPGTPVPGACNDDACGGDRSQLVLTLDAGTYYVLLDGHDDSHFGPFDLLFQLSSCTVPRITSDGDRSGNTSGHGNSLRGSCGGARADEDAYYFALCRSTSITSHTCNSATRYNTVLYYRTGSCWDDNPEPACNNNFTCGATTAGASRITATLPQGLSFVVIDGYDGAQGAYVLNVSGLP